MKLHTMMLRVLVLVIFTIMSGCGSGDEPSKVTEEPNKYTVYTTTLPPSTYPVAAFKAEGTGKMMLITKGNPPYSNPKVYEIEEDGQFQVVKSFEAAFSVSYLGMVNSKHYLRATGSESEIWIFDQDGEFSNFPLNEHKIYLDIQNEFIYGHHYDLLTKKLIMVQYDLSGNQIDVINLNAYKQDRPMAFREDNGNFYFYDDRLGGGGSGYVFMVNVLGNVEWERFFSDETGILFYQDDILVLENNFAEDMTKLHSLDKSSGEDKWSTTLTKKEIYSMRALGVIDPGVIAYKYQSIVNYMRINLATGTVNSIDQFPGSHHGSFSFIVQGDELIFSTCINCETAYDSKISTFVGSLSD